MEPTSEEYDVLGPHGGKQWYQSEGINEKGTTTFVNFFVNDEKEVAPLAHGLGISKSISFHQKAEHIGTRGEFDTL